MHPTIVHRAYFQADDTTAVSSVGMNIAHGQNVICMTTETISSKQGSRLLCITGQHKISNGLHWQMGHRRNQLHIPERPGGVAMVEYIRSC